MNNWSQGTLVATIVSFGLGLASGFSHPEYVEQYNRSITPQKIETVLIVLRDGDLRMEGIRGTGRKRVHLGHRPCHGFIDASTFAILFATIWLIPFFFVRLRHYQKCA